MMKFRSILYLLSIAFILQWIPFQTRAFSREGSFERMERDIFVLTNQYRQKKNLPPLEINATLTRLARQHSEDMARGRQRFGHGGAEKRFKIAGHEIKGVQAFWENVAYGYESADDAVQGWIKSTGHRRNMESNATMTGIGIASDKKGSLYFTVLFVR